MITQSGYYLVYDKDDTPVPGVGDTRFPNYTAAVKAAKDLVGQDGKRIRLIKVQRKGLVEIKPPEVVYNSGK